MRMVRKQAAVGIYKVPTYFFHSSVTCNALHLYNIMFYICPVVDNNTIRVYYYYTVYVVNYYYIMYKLLSRVIIIIIIVSISKFFPPTDSDE